MMKQFFELKAKHPDAIMLFRCGDFYETYSEDAIVASEILGITLTKRANGQAKSVEMAGFPFHALDTYLPKLVRAGKRVAICDQLEDPKMTKKLVKRGITELVTPGVAINDNVLSYKENNFLAAVHFGKASCGVAFLDISTGEFLTAEGPFDYIDKLLNNFAPKEVLFERGKRGMFEGNFGSKFFTFELDDWVFNESSSREKLLKHFETKNLKGFGVEHLKNGIVASGAILQYLNMTQHYQIGHITSLSRIEEDRYVRLDKFTVRSLELIGSMNEGGTSLLDVIDRTISPMGARLLKRWVVFPLKDEKPVNERLDVVDYFFRKKLAYAYIRRAQAPFALLLGEMRDWNHTLLAANDTLETVRGACTVSDIETGAVLWEGDFLAPPNRTTPLADLRMFYSEQRMLLIRWTANGKRGFNHYLCGMPPFSFAKYKLWLAKLQAVEAEG